MAIKKPPPKTPNLLQVNANGTIPKSLTKAGTPTKDKRSDHLVAQNTKPSNFLTPDRSRATESSGGAKQRNVSHSPSSSKHFDWGNTEILPKPTKHPLEQHKKPISSAVFSVEGQQLEGMWQQYEGIWFDMHSKEMGPIFGDMPTPKPRSVSSQHGSFSQANIPTSTKSKNPVSAKWKKPKFLGDDDDDLILCLKCKNKKRKGVYLGCMHFFCKECLYEHFKKHLEEKRVPIRCMAQNCKYEIERNELVKIAHNSEEIKMFYDMNVTKFVEKRPHQLIQCFSQGCGYVVDFSKAKDKNTLSCPRCKKNYCIGCHQNAHPGTNCEEAKE